MSGSGGLKPRAVAGRPSVTRLTQRSWTGMRASGRPMAAVRKMLKRDGRGERELEEFDNGKTLWLQNCALEGDQIFVLVLLTVVVWVGEDVCVCEDSVRKPRTTSTPHTHHTSTQSQSQRMDDYDIISPCVRSECVCVRVCPYLTTSPILDEMR